MFYCNTPSERNRCYQSEWENTAKTRITGDFGVLCGGKDEVREREVFMCGFCRLGW